MAPVVDRFVIVESWETFSGRVKKEKLWKDVHADIFAPYADKIEWMILDTLGPVQEGVPLSSEEVWKREHAQRNAPTDWLRSQEGPWIALICDVDEIVSPAAISNAKSMPKSFDMPCSLEMDFFYYNFNWVKGDKWYAVYIISDTGVATLVEKYDASGKILVTLSTLRDHFITTRGHFKRGAIQSAGWHASFFASTEEIQRKLRSYSHQEWNTAEYTSAEHITKCITSGADLFTRGGAEDLIAFDVTGLPQSFQKFNDQVKSMQGIPSNLPNT